MTGTVVVTALLSLLLCRSYLRLARDRQILDTPNERSSHSAATPSGGGVALMTAFLCGLLFAHYGAGSWGADFIVLAAAALLLSALGFIDDLRPLSATLRLGVYAAVCAAVAALLLQPWRPGAGAGELVTLVVVALVMLWSLNLFNFMDGIDGIAALQAILACAGAAALSWLSGGASHYALFCLVLASAHGGFLWFNLPPARLFMGDAGSVPTGFLLAGLALLGAVQDSLNPLCWLVLTAVFVTDASVTLLWRLATGQRVTQAHRLHAYQRMARYWNSHGKVDALLVAINLLWLLPLALAVQSWPDKALILVILAYLPLVVGMAKVRRFT